MSNPTLHKTFFAALLVAVCAFSSCEKEPIKPKKLPLVTYSVLIYDSVEGTNAVAHYSIQRTLEIKYDPNVDKCFMQNNNINTPAIDTFDRSTNWKRGYINRRDLLHRIIFNGDTITIHHNVNNQIGQSGFRYTQGVQL